MAKTTATTQRKVVTPGGAKTTPTTAKAHTSSSKPTPKSSGDDITAALAKILASKDTGATTDTTNNPFVSDYEAWLLDGGHKLYTGSRPGATSQYKNPANMLKSLSSRNPATVKALMEKLYAAGFFGNTNAKDIAWTDGSDPRNRAAYAWAIALAVQTDEDRGGGVMSFDQFLDQRSKDFAGLVGQGGSGQKFAFQPQDPAAVRAAIEEVVPKYLGQRLSEGETAALVSEINAKSQQAARAAFNANQNGGVASPAFDPKTYVETRARELHPDLAGATDRATVAQTFLDAIHAGSGGLQTY